MITGAIKNKIDKIWTDIWAGGNHPAVDCNRAVDLLDVYPCSR